MYVDADTDVDFDDDDEDLPLMMTKYDDAGDAGLSLIYEELVMRKRLYSQRCVLHCMLLLLLLHC